MPCIGTAARAEALPSNAIEAINVAQQGNEVSLRIDLKEVVNDTSTGIQVLIPQNCRFEIDREWFGQKIRGFAQHEYRYGSVTAPAWS